MNTVVVIYLENGLVLYTISLIRYNYLHLYTTTWMTLTNIMLNDGCQTQKGAKLISVVRRLYNGCPWRMCLEGCTDGASGVLVMH